MSAIFSFPPPAASASLARHVVRLAAGTPVLTARGIRPAEDLRAGDRLIGRRGMLRLRETWALPAGGVEMLAAEPGPEGPAGTVLLPADQPVLWRAPARPARVVEARHLAEGDAGHRLLHRPEVRLLALCFDAPATIYAGELQLVTVPLPPTD